MTNEKRQIRPGDVVKQIKFLQPGENPLAKVIEIEHDEKVVKHRHLNKAKTNSCHMEYFKFAGREEIIYDE